MTTHTKEPRCSEGYGAKSLRVLRAAKARGMRLSAAGQVILPTGRVHLGTPQDGRDRINLSVDGERITIQVARVVCFLAHGEPPEANSVVDHIDGNTLNDAPSNLRWSSYSANLRNNHENREHERRVRACLAACAGIPTEALEAGALAEAIAGLDEIREGAIDRRPGHVDYAKNRTRAQIWKIASAAMERLGDLDSWAQVRALRKSTDIEGGGLL